MRRAERPRSGTGKAQCEDATSTSTRSQACCPTLPALESFDSSDYRRKEYNAQLISFFSTVDNLPTFETPRRVPASTRTIMQTTAKSEHGSTPQRRVLGDISPNVRATVAPLTPAFLRKVPAGSPLKRSFTAAMEGGEGFRYLKKRKLTGDELLSQLHSQQERPLENESGKGQVEAVRCWQSLCARASQLTVQQASFATTASEEQDVPSDVDDSASGSSSEGKSFSSLINYDPSSQTSNLVFKTLSNAETLRLRLRVAMYKVRTNQIDVPFRDLRVEGRSGAPAKPSAEEIKAAVAALRKEAQDISERRPTAPRRLLPAPVLRPTPYSSRMIYETYFTSSPPVAESPARYHIQGESGGTPQRELYHLSSPPDSAQRFARPMEQELTSSVVKGRVAEGLLGLRNAT